MRVLSFSYCFPQPGRPTWGVFVAQRLAALARQVELEVASPVPTLPLLGRLGSASLPQQDEVMGLKVWRPRFAYLPGLLKSLDARLYARGLHGWLVRYLQKRTVDLLDAHFVWPDGVGVWLLARQVGLPYAITLRGKIYPCLDVPAQRRQCADALRNAAAVISVDSRMAQIAVDLGAPADRVHVIPNGVDRKRFQPMNRVEARAQLGLPADGRLLVTVAHLGPRKGHREVIEALRLLPRDVRLVLVGGDPAGGANERALKSLARRTGVADRVILAGPQPYDRIPLYFAACDASVLASYREGCPNVVLESLACGRPVVATDVGAVPDLIDEARNGRIVPARDVKSLTEGIRDVFEREWPPEAVRSSRAVRSWDEVAATVVDVLAACVGAERPSPCAGGRVE